MPSGSPVSGERESQSLGEEARPSVGVGVESWGAGRVPWQCGGSRRPTVGSDSRGAWLDLRRELGEHLRAETVRLSLAEKCGLHPESCGYCGSCLTCSESCFRQTARWERALRGGWLCGARSHSPSFPLSSQLRRAGRCPAASLSSAQREWGAFPHWGEPRRREAASIERKRGRPPPGHGPLSVASLCRAPSTSSRLGHESLRRHLLGGHGCHCSAESELVRPDSKTEQEGGSRKGSWTWMPTRCRLGHAGRWQASCFPCSDAVSSSSPSGRSPSPWAT